MEQPRWATSDDKNTEDVSVKTSITTEDETLEGKTISLSSGRDDRMIPEICVEPFCTGGPATDHENPNVLDYLGVDMCSSARKTALKISSCSAVTRRISEASAVNMPGRDQLSPTDDRRTRRRKQSLSLDPQILLQWAATHNDVDTLKSLLESTNVDVNEPGVDGFYPLHRAASTGSLECLQVLVTKGAQLEVRDKDGSSPLDAAVSEGEFDCARFLIEKGANINHIRDGFTDKDLLHRKKRGMTIL